MRTKQLLHWLASIAVAALLAAAVGGASDAQTRSDLEALRGQAARLHAEGNYAEAIAVVQQIVVLTEKMHGADHPVLATWLNNLAVLHRRQGRYTEAEPLYKRALAISEKMLGPNHPDIGRGLNGIATLFQDQGKAGEAEPLYLRSLAIREAALGSRHPDVAETLNNLAELYRTQGRFTEARPLYERSLAIREASLGPDHGDVAQSLNNLALLYKLVGDYGKAEPLYKRSLEIKEALLSSDHPDVAQLLANLATLLRAQGRDADAELTYKRAITSFENSLGAEHLEVAKVLGNLGQLYLSHGRNQEAELAFRRSMSIFLHALGRDHPDVATSLNDLALVLKTQGRFDEAEPLYLQSLAIAEKMLGTEHPNVSSMLNNLGSFHESLGRFAEAESFYNRSLAISEKVLGPDHPHVGDTLDNLASLSLAQRDLPLAADRWRRAAAILKRRAKLGLASHRWTPQEEAQRKNWYFEGFIKTAQRLAAKSQGDRLALTMEAYETAQWATSSSAAASLVQMAERSSVGNPSLATVVRERQDFVAEWQRRDAQRTAAASQPPDKRNRRAEAANVARLNDIETRITAIDARLKSEFPDYAALSNPEPLSITQVQADLRPDEAFVLFLDTSKWDHLPEETFIWAVTKTEARWVRTDLGTTSLTADVAALRCGFDATAWDGKGGKRCAELTGGVYTDADREAGKPLPFDAAHAHKIYTGLFGEVADLIKGKHLLLGCGLN